MERARSIAAVAHPGARRVGLAALVAAFVLALVGAPVAHAATLRVHPDPLSPLRLFIAVVPATPAPLVILHEDERAHLDALTCERPVTLPGGLDALRRATSPSTAPGGR